VAWVVQHWRGVKKKRVKGENENFNLRRCLAFVFERFKAAQIAILKSGQDEGIFKRRVKFAA
jgi:hypothetical protein